MRSVRGDWCFLYPFPSRTLGPSCSIDLLMELAVLLLWCTSAINMMLRWLKLEKAVALLKSAVLNCRLRAVGLVCVDRIPTPLKKMFVVGVIRRMN